jgi:hypothetical protein
MNRIIEIHFANVLLHKELQQVIIFALKNHPKDMLIHTKELLSM